MKSILILLHVESNTGYAIGPLEATFFQIAMAACNNDRSRVHFAYPSMSRGPSDTLPADFNQYVVVDVKRGDVEHCKQVQAYLEKHDIDTIFGFDQPVHLPIYKYFRRAGVKHFISYWGAPMSSIFGIFKRTLKRIEVAMRRHGPDHYIFESQGMADTAVRGRGIPASRTSVVYLGVDIERFRPDGAPHEYVYEKLNIARQRRVFFYSGHMEPRKGVAVIMQAANLLAQLRPKDDWEIALFGNKGGDEQPFVAMLSDEAAKRVTFGGYRSDIDAILPGCYAGIIASTGWDSFPRSAMEMQAAGLPLAVSKLPGLRESIEDQQTGILFDTGDHQALAAAMNRLLEDEALHRRMADTARRRIESKFSLQVQFNNLLKIVKTIAS